MNKHTLLIKQLDERFAVLRKALFYFEPKQSSIRILRKALGMTIEQLAKILKVHHSRIPRIEADEISGALTIKTLEKVAKALHCRLVYALVPDKSLQDIINDQAYILAAKQVEQVNHNMALENQALSATKIKQQVEEVKNNLLSKSRKSLWENDA